MKKGFLSKYFEGVAAKRLSAVEAHPSRSNQHEFNGVQDLKRILGKDKRTLPARFIYLGENEEATAVADGSVTWYDARELHPTRSEYRLYFPTTPVSEKASAGDLLVIGKRPDSSVLVLVAEARSTVENQVLWLFGLQDLAGARFAVRDIRNGGDIRLNFASKFILGELGLELETDENYLEAMLRQFPSGFPTTRAFSAFARSALKGLSSVDDPDGALVAWIDEEETLFRTLERHLVVERIQKGFGSDVDAFVEFSLSVHNRRKSRAGFALENHMEQVFRDNGVRCSRGQVTEHRSRPDFLFPGAREYHDPAFPTRRLTMLGTKSTCKDRWRQVLAEAEKIKDKHLLTLEPGISEDQTNEMKANRLRLVLPTGLHATYKPAQRAWLMDIGAFIRLAKNRQ